MAIIHRTTMSPGKLELLAAWLPAQPWYPGTGRAPELAKARGVLASAAPAAPGRAGLTVSAASWPAQHRQHPAAPA